MPIEEGQPAPAFTLKDTDGAEVTLADLRGKNVVLYFYPKDDTPGCTKEACGFRDLWSEIQDENALVFGVSPDDGASHRRFIEKFSLPFRLLCDPQRSVMTQYDAFGEKTQYGKKMMGVIRSTVWIDPEGIVKKHWRRVTKADEHPQKVLEALRAAG